MYWFGASGENCVRCSFLFVGCRFWFAVVSNKHDLHVTRSAREYSKLSSRAGEKKEKKIKKKQVGEPAFRSGGLFCYTVLHGRLKGHFSQMGFKI